MLSCLGLEAVIPDVGSEEVVLAFDFEAVFSNFETVALRFGAVFLDLGFAAAVLPVGFETVALDCGFGGEEAFSSLLDLSGECVGFDFLGGCRDPDPPRFVRLPLFGPGLIPGGPRWRRITTSSSAMYDLSFSSDCSSLDRSEDPPARVL